MRGLHKRQGNEGNSKSALQLTWHLGLVIASRQSMIWVELRDAGRLDALSPFSNTEEFIHPSTARLAAVHETLNTRLLEAAAAQDHH